MTRPASSYTRTLSARALLLGALLSAPIACGGAEMTAPRAPGAGPDLDAESLGISLLPPGAIAAATVDTRALYDDRTIGAQVGQLAEAILPLGAEAGVVPSRDVDRVTVAWYAVTGADFVAVLRGRFDPAAIQRAADAHRADARGGLLGATPYSGHTMYTVAGVGFTVLTPRTVLAGTAAGLRLALDRIRDGHVRADLSPAFVEALQAKDAPFAVVGDFSSAPLTAAAGLPLPPWAGAIRGLRASGALRAERLSVTATLTFPDADRARAAADGVRQIGGLVNALAIAGVVPELKDLDVAADRADVRVAFGVDETKLRALLVQLPQWLPPVPARGAPPPPSANTH